MAGPQIRIVEDKAQVDGGWAIVVVDRMGQYLGDGTIGIRRLGYDASHLSPAGWRVADARLPAERWEIRDGALHLYLGPDVTEFLTPDDHVTIDVNGIAGQATVAWPVITPYYGGKTLFRRFAERPAPPPPPPPPLEEPTLMVARPPLPPPEPVPVVEEETIRPERMVEPAAPPQRMSLGWLGPALWCVLCLAIGAAAWANRDTATAVDLPGRVEPSLPTPPPPPPPPLASDLPGTPAPPMPPPDLSVQDIVRRAQSTQEIYDWARKYRDKGDYQGMLLLLENAAERGHGKAMFEIAQAYDPASFVAGKPFSKANPAQAAKFYRKAEAAGVLEAKAALVALKQVLEKAAAAGDAEAKAALATYWPQG